jgi:hypothetical protein
LSSSYPDCEGAMARQIVCRLALRRFFYRAPRSGVGPN